MSMMTPSSIGNAIGASSANAPVYPWEVVARILAQKGSRRPDSGPDRRRHALALSMRSCWSGYCTGATAMISSPWSRWRSGRWRTRRWQHRPPPRAPALPMARGETRWSISSVQNLLAVSPGLLVDRPLTVLTAPRSSAEVASVRQLKRVQAGGEGQASHRRNMPVVRCAGVTW